MIAHKKKIQYPSVTVKGPERESPQLTGHRPSLQCDVEAQSERRKGSVMRRF